MKNPTVKIIIGVVAILLVVAVAIAALWPDDNGTTAIGKLWNPPSTTAARKPNGTTARPASTTTTTTVALPTSTPQGGNATVPTVQDPDTGKTVIEFPCRVDPYGLVIERLAPYTGKYVEDGSNTTANGVAMILVRNESGHPIQFASLTMTFEGQTLMFEISALPAGGKAVVQEKMRRGVPQGDPSACDALVVQQAEQGFAADQVSVTENEDGSLTVTNLTDETIPAVRVFYKYYLDKEQIYVGGIAFTAKVSQLRPHSSYTIRPTHYEKGSSRIVMVTAYEEDAG